MQQTSGESGSLDNVTPGEPSTERMSLGAAIRQRTRLTTRRPLDLLLALAGGVTLAAVLLLVRLTADGVDTPPPGPLRTLLPASLLALASGVANLAVILLVCVTIVERLIHREFRHILRALLAACLGYALAGALNAVAFHIAGPAGPPEALATPPYQGGLTQPLHGYLAAAVGYAQTMGPAHMPRVRVGIWAGIAVTAASVLLSGFTTPLGLALTFVLGWTCAWIARYSVGITSPAPEPARLVRELRRLGIDPLDITADGTDQEGHDRFAIDTVDRRFDAVLVRADVATGFWKRLFSRLLLRDPAAPPVLFTLRRRVEHTALLDFAAQAAGAAVPRLLALGDLGPGTTLLVREHVRTRSLAQLHSHEITDALLDEVWNGLALLHRHRIAHRNVSDLTVGLRMDGRAVFHGMSTGDVAAGGFAASLDTAALLTTLALRVGARRAVESAVRHLGTETVAATLPFLQPAGLPRTLRRRMRSSSITLGDVRTEINRIEPEAPAGPAKLERMRPRTVVSVAAATIVGVLLASQLTDVDLTTISGANLVWTAAAFVTSLVVVFAAALVLIGFVPVRLPLWSTVLVQFAGSFIRIAAPAGLGSLALNTRYATRMGASAGLAISAVGVSQLVGLLTHVALLLICAYLAGTAYPADFSPSAILLVVAGVLSVAVAAVLAFPALRRAIMNRVRPYFQGVLPQLLDLAQQPRRLVLGLGGTLLLTVGFVLCLHFSIVAFGGSANLAAVAVVFLAGNAVGSAAPTPGGLGAVEAALLGGLTTVAGVPASAALPAVLLFRLLTFWFPVLPGWGAFHYLQRKKLI
ncbi:lysylphosphatidylglycerol synthase transmembrane domain-containing protein [Salinactinospora qingdaonensis]|uniref:TIGR00374 family protein n=1 Tax=Salinactinospora qingdaonensis TaxID=702744 RepID=A0ABP7GHJ0_9ACTN